jgi:DNA-binding NtrC family response regulator
MDILVVEDDNALREAVAEALQSEGHEVRQAGDGAQAVGLLESEVFDLLLTDVRLPRVDGLTLLGMVRERFADTDVLVMTGHAEVEDAVDVLKQQALDYLTKPFELGALLDRVARAASDRADRQRIGAPHGSGAGGASVRPMIGESRAFIALQKRTAAVADSDASVIIRGETGTGKELVARQLHDLSPRAKRPFVAINCAAFPESLLESELFGHERGAFTGASRRRRGRFQAANGGTLFLDEIAEMPLIAQAKLLRVLQDGSFEPVGSDKTVTVDVRIVSASHAHLTERVRTGLFREDLFFRLKVFEIQVPPLRERKDDIPLLISHFLERFLRPSDRTPRFSSDALAALRSFDYPGNVRELEHAVQHAIVLSRGHGTVTVEHLPDDIRLAFQETRQALRPLTIVTDEAERAHLHRALELVNGRRTEAADLLGVSRKTLWNKLQKHGLLDWE